jgi:hypothetical protein
MPTKRLHSITVEEARVAKGKVTARRVHLNNISHQSRRRVFKIRGTTMGVSDVVVAGANFDAARFSIVDQAIMHPGQRKQLGEMLQAIFELGRQFERQNPGAKIDDYFPHS